LGNSEAESKATVQVCDVVDSLSRVDHKVGYFADLMARGEEIHDCVRPLLRLSREHIERAQKLDYALVSSLERDPLLKERLLRLRTVPGVGPITALTWALEIGDFTR
jgi:transposase